MFSNIILDKTIKAYIIIGLLLYVFLFLIWKDSVTYYNILNLFTFVSYAFILYTNTNKPEEFYTNAQLATVVSLYSLSFVGMYLMVSIYYTDDTFWGDYTDPFVYANISDKIVRENISTIDIPSYLISHYRWGYDDWGAPIIQSSILKIVPSKHFLFLFQIILGTIASLALFSIGKKIMKIDYAYIGALSYALSSFSLYYYGSYRKESIMVFFVIITFYFFYRYLASKTIFYLGISFLFSLSMFLFRPPVAVFFWVGTLSFFVFRNGFNSKFLLASAVFLIIIGMAYSVILDNFNRFTTGGDITKGENYIHATSFSIFVSCISSMTGPFPQLLQIGINKFSNLAMNGSGLLFKFLLFFAFWKGFLLCIRNREENVIPVYIFCILEMIGLAIVNDGLELRKAMPHIPLFYVAAFWFMSQYDDDVDDTILRSPYYIWSNRVFSFCIGIVFIASLFWNTLRFS